MANMSVCLRWMGRPQKAMRASERALEMSTQTAPERRILEVNHGTMMLTCNPHNPSGWRQLDARLRTGLSTSETTYMQKTFWGGEACEELCLWDEQGFGDTLMALRWVEAAMKRSKKCKLIVRNSFVELLKKRLEVPKKCSIVAMEGINVPPWRCGTKHAPLMSLPGVLGETDLNRAKRGGYLKRTNLRKPSSRVGLTWAAGKKEEAEAERMRLTRCIPTESVIRLLKHWPTSTDKLVVLQIGEEAKLTECYLNVEYPAAPRDWEQTAKLVEELDIVITVDTAMAHLAGALGVPTLLLLNRPCDWRWGQGNQPTVTWYEKMNILRCNQFNEWDSILRMLPEEVRKLRRH